MQKCVAARAFDTALEGLQRAQELGLQFFRGDSYYVVMKGAVLNKQLDVAMKYAVVMFRGVCGCPCPCCISSCRAATGACTQIHCLRFHAGCP